MQRIRNKIKQLCDKIHRAYQIYKLENRIREIELELELRSEAVAECMKKKHMLHANLNHYRTLRDSF